MSSTSIPNWNLSGLIPPIREGEKSGIDPDRSPYRICMLDFVKRFELSPHRRDILKGFLNFRSYLHGLGLTKGLQWLDGSFVEHKEAREGKDPADIDVVTFCYLPEGVSQESLLSSNPEMFQASALKSHFLVDGYFMFLGEMSDEGFLHRISYWYSMWSHTRQQEWKGFLELDLSPDQDQIAVDFLNEEQTQI